jgi:hypothetical protein
MNGKKQVFEASQLAGQPGKPLHTAEGIVTIPYTFQSPGDYSVNILDMEFFLIRLGLNRQNIPLRWLLNFPVASLTLVAMIVVLRW